jgi:hypothetical protein
MFYVEENKEKELTEILCKNYSNLKVVYKDFVLLIETSPKTAQQIL